MDDVEVGSWRTPLLKPLILWSEHSGSTKNSLGCLVLCYMNLFSVDRKIQNHWLITVGNHQLLSLKYWKKVLFSSATWNLESLKNPIFVLKVCCRWWCCYFTFLHRLPKNSASKILFFLNKNFNLLLYHT